MDQLWELLEYSPVLEFQSKLKRAAPPFKSFINFKTTIIFLIIFQIF